MSNELHNGEAMRTEPRTDTPTSWGRINFAGGRVPAMAVAIPAGLADGRNSTSPKSSASPAKQSSPSNADGLTRLCR